jgi:anaphase-promoting complex subunit 3
MAWHVVLTASLQSGTQGKRPKAGTRSQSISDAEDTQTLSSGSLAHSPRSDSTENLNTGPSATPETRKNIAIAERYVFDLMKVFARAQHHLSKYECRAAIECLERLPQSQQMAPTVMIMTARAHYELVEYIQVCLLGQMNDHFVEIDSVYRQNALSRLPDG